MFTFMLLTVVAGAEPAYVVENRCSTPYVVVNNCTAAPAAKAKPVKVTNGFNCGASFCGANGGAGCPSCPNGNGVCACGPTVKQSLTVPSSDPLIKYALPSYSGSSCPGGNCPTSTRRGLFGWR